MNQMEFVRVGHNFAEAHHMAAAAAAAGEEPRTAVEVGLQDKAAVPLQAQETRREPWHRADREEPHN